MADLRDAEHCAFHPDREAYVHCVRCGRAICGDCVITASVGQQCPECVKEGRRRVRSIAPNRAHAAVYAIMGVTIASFALDAVTGHRLTVKGMSQAYLVFAENEWWRLITPVLFHAGIFHLLLNMYALYVLGTVFEDGQGQTRFLITYFVSAISATTASLVVPVLINPAAAAVSGGSIGASGAVFGLFGGLALLLWKRRQQAAARAYLGQIAILIVLNLIIGFTIGGIDNNAHIGGLIGGAIVAVGFDVADARPRFAKWWWVGAASVLVISAVLLFVGRALLIAQLSRSVT